MRRGVYASKKLEDNGNLKSAHKLVTSHLRLVAKLPWVTEVMVS